MKCTLELRQIEYQSSEYTDRQFTNLIAALGGCVGFDVLSGLKMQLRSMGDVAIREYTSLRSAEEDSGYLLGKIFPTFKIPIDELDSAEVLEILRVIVESFKPPVTPVAKAFEGLTPTEVIAVNYAADECDHSPVTVANAWNAISSARAVAGNDDDMAGILMLASSKTGIAYETLASYRSKIQASLDYQLSA